MEGINRRIEGGFEYGGRCESNQGLKETIRFHETFTKPKQAWLSRELMDICNQQTSADDSVNNMGTRNQSDEWTTNGGFLPEKLEPDNEINWSPTDWPAPEETELALQSIINEAMESDLTDSLWKEDEENNPTGWEQNTKDMDPDGDMECVLGVKEEVVYTTVPPKPAPFKVVELLVVNEETGDESCHIQPESITLQFSNATNTNMLNEIPKMSTLLQHGAIHSDARPFVCDICQHSFNRISTLISHRKTHSGAKPHVCPHCGKRFHQKGNLRNHVFTHTNERPYKCEICSKGFNQKSNLICHQARYHRLEEGYPRKKRTQPINVRLISSDLDLAVIPGTEKGSLVVDALTCSSVRAAISNGDMVFVLYQPLNGAEQMMRLLPVNRDKHMLIPVSVADLKTARPGAAQQFQVTTLATLYEKVATGGGVEIVESPNTSVCEIKLEPAFQNLSITQIQGGWQNNMNLANGLTLSELTGDVETITSEVITMENLQFVDFPGMIINNEESVLS